ncbi:Proliferating cell nuclear antigen [Hypsibius exemplaris]|uniref:DNA sliding clamp PCNA n=1 Tax=Hypsibius exemplaris TaxID=2072580 RepID=A0A1W0WMK4_HYPEX|nr:Proliferating cell nuclear antigen [Hypsibius exemplaris]
MTTNGAIFEVKMAQASVLKKVIDAIKDLLGDSSWDCTNSGMSLQAMDSAHVALVNVLLRSEGFENYRCNRNVTLGISLGSLTKVLKCAGNDDELTIRHDDKTNVVTFGFTNDESERYAEFDLKLMNLDSESLAIPEIEYDCVVKMPSTEFRRVVQDLAQFGDSIDIVCAKTNVLFEATGDIGKGQIRLSERSSKKSDQDVTIEMIEPVRLTFALKYLNMFTKATPISDVVQLALSNNHPLCLEYPIPEVGRVRFYLAPKINEEN